MQWVLIMTLVTGSGGAAVHTEIFYAEESCKVAAATFEDMQGTSLMGSSQKNKARCVPRSVGKFGEMRIDKDPK